MPLSLSKLQAFLTEKGLVVNRYFTLDGSCFFLELFSSKTAEVFLLYIPSKYEINVGHGENVHKLELIDMSESDNLPEEYGGERDENDERIVLEGKIEDTLETNYKRPISLKAVTDEESAELRAVYRQLKRLAYSVQDLKYKLGIVYKNYICAIRRDDSINCYAAKRYPRDDVRQLFVIADLETLYEKGEDLLQDVQTVRKSIYRVLEKTQYQHTQSVERFIESKKAIVSSPEISADGYEGLLAELEEMVVVMAEAEKRRDGELSQLSEVTRGGLQGDINRVHRKLQLEKELAKIADIQESISKTIFTVKEKRENVLLTVNNIMFDNTVMLDRIVKNFAKLKEFV